MSVYPRIILYIISGWLMSSGRINAELRDMLNDPQAADMLQPVFGTLVAGSSWVWWRIAKRFGWAT